MIAILPNRHAQRAADLLVNYFEAIAKRAGMKWDNDYTVEIEEAIEEIIEATAETIRDMNHES